MKRLKALADKPVIGGMVKKAMASLASNDAKNISEHFSKYLKPEVAATIELKHEVYRLRHKVYCEELHFEDIKPDFEECDEFDERSIHCFVRHLNSSNLAGTARMITSAEDSELLPIEKFCSHAITDPDIFPAKFKRNEICEISRLAVPKEFRKREVDKYAGAATGAINVQAYSPTELRCFPYIAVCLYMSVAALSFRTKRYHGFVMMEPRLARSLQFVGINFKQLGEPIEFHGKRAPYYIDSREMKKNLSPGYLKLLHAIEKDLFNINNSPPSDSGSLITSPPIMFC